MNHKKLVAFARAQVLAIGALCTTWCCSEAHGQWLPDRAYTAGPGIRVGDLELHPGLALRAGYDTNVFRSDVDEVGSAILALTPHLNIRTLSRQRVAQGEEAAGYRADQLPPPIAFNAGLSSTLFYYTENRAPTNVEFDTNAGVSILPERVVGFDLGIDYARTTRPFTFYTGDNANSKYARDVITPIANLRAQSRSGVLRGNVSYRPSISIYENGVFKYLNATNHEIQGGSSWKFLPYTAVVYDASVQLVRYDDPERTFAVVRLTDSDRLATRLGLNGQVTPLLSARALVGYAVVHNTRREFDDKEDVIGEAALRYGTAINSGEIGYQRMIQVAPLGSWMQLDRGYVKAGFLFSGQFALGFDAGVAHVNYGNMLAIDGSALGVDRDTNRATSKREDIRIDAGVHGEWRATNWFAIMADFTTLSTLTDFRFATATALPYPAQFKSYQVFGGVRFHY